MKTKFLLGTTILLGTSLLPLSVISCSNQVTSNEGENKPSIPGEGNTNPTPPTDNGGQQPSQPTIVYHEITGYNDINMFIKNNTEIVSNLISQVDKTFGSLVSHEWVVDPQIIYDNMKVKKNEDGYIYIDISGVTFSSVSLKYKYFDKQEHQKESSISVGGKSVNIELHFKSKTDFIGGIY